MGIRAIALCFGLVFCPFPSLAGELEEIQMGPVSIGNQGAGATEEEAVLSLFSNPAGAHIIQGQGMAAGITDLNSGVFPFAAYGKKSSRYISYALMYYGNESMGRDSSLQGVLANVSYRPNAYVKAGFNIYSQSINGKFAADISAGIQYFPRSDVSLGFFGSNLAESRFGSVKGAAFFPRTTVTGVSYQPFSLFKASLEFLSEGGDVTNWEPFASLGFIFGKTNQVKISPGFKGHFKDPEKLFTSLKVEFNSSVNNNRMGFCYAIGGVALGQSAEVTRQSLAIRLQLGFNSDKEKPLCSAEEKSGQISLLAGSQKKDAVFHLWASDKKSPLKTWQFVVCQKEKNGEPGSLIKSFSGKGLPPKFLMWDGRNSSKELVQPGFYFYRLIVQDEAGNAGYSSWQLIEVKN